MKKTEVEHTKTKVVVFKKGPVLARNEQWNLEVKDKKLLTISYT